MSDFPHWVTGAMGSCRFCNLLSSPNDHCLFSILRSLSSRLRGFRFFPMWDNLFSVRLVLFWATTTALGTDCWWSWGSWWIFIDRLIVVNNRRNVIYYWFFFYVECSNTMIWCNFHTQKSVITIHFEYLSPMTSLKAAALKMPACHLVGTSGR